MFAGDLLIFKAVPALKGLAEAAEGMISECGLSDYSDDKDPALQTAIMELQSRFRSDGTVRQAAVEALEQAGVDSLTTYWDWLYLRVQMPVRSTSLGTLGIHRDTWSSNVYAQTNWWTPIRPVDPERTIAFYPQYWARPLDNTSVDWDLDEIRAKRRSGEVLEDVPLVPVPTDAPEADSDLRIVIEPGDFLCFSGAHVHRSVPNTKREIRFSLEVRTVSEKDFLSGVGAPNVDGSAPRRPLEWFKGIASGASLGELEHANQQE